MNHKRAVGALLSLRTEGTNMTMTARLGRYPIRFGPSAKKLGGELLECVVVKSNEVHAYWAGVAACLAQATGVIRTEYDSEEDLIVGGAHVCQSTVILPNYEKITFGIDDTDVKEKGATWVLALQCGEACTIEGAVFLGMRLFS